MLARRVGCGVVVFLTLALTQVAAAASWKAEHMVLPQTIQGQAYSVSCGAADSCEGVGQVVTANGSLQPLAESWNGSHWTVQHVPTAPGMPVAYLTAVSCSHSDACSAVGSYQGTQSGGEFAERWNGHRWVLQRMPTLSMPIAAFNAISCGAEKACTAVGYQIKFTGNTGIQVPLIETWNGSAWRTQVSPVPAGAKASTLAGVACTTPKTCTAVGGYLSAQLLSVPMAQSLTASGWKLQTVPLPTGAKQAFANAVSCTAANACTAVGSILTGPSEELAMAQRWDGASWKPQTVPAPTGTRAMTLTGVSCSGDLACTAVGGTLFTSSSAPAVERWNGSSWHLQTTPPERNGFLNAVSCPSGTSCTALGTPGIGGAAAALEAGALGTSAVGTTGLGALGTAAFGREGLGTGASGAGASGMARFGAGAAGSFPAASSVELLPRPGLLAGAPNLGSPPAAGGPAAWTAAEQRAPTEAASALLQGSFAGPASVDSALTSLTLAEHWNGTGWKVQPTPALTGAATAFMTGVSCTGQSRCIAVGFYDDNARGLELPLAELRSGSSWKLQTVPQPPKAFAADLNGVSCSAAGACTAVGSYFGSSSQGAFAARWDGSDWMLQRVPSPSGKVGLLNAVSCSAAHACTAVGLAANSHTGAATTLAEFWNGTAWTVQQTANAPGNTSSQLLGVSCDSANSCMAVGASASNVKPEAAPLSELRSGKSWRLEKVPEPKGSFLGGLNGVSCTSPTACTAVGQWNSNTSGGTLAVRWNGTAWTMQSTPGKLFGLTGVSCSTSKSCRAVGGPFGAAWNGTTWTIQPFAPPPVPGFPSVIAVSCTAPAQCSGVGIAVVGVPVALAERYS